MTSGREPGWNAARSHTISLLCARSVCVCVCAPFPVPLGTLLSLGFGCDPDSRVKGCCCEAVGGWPGQHEDFWWVVRLDVVQHSSSCSHPLPRVSALCQAHFPLKVNIASLQCYRTLECHLGAKPSYMWFSIIAWIVS